MANPMSDYLSAVAAEYTGQDITLDCHVELPQKVQKEQFVHRFSDGQRGVVTLSDDSQFEVNVQWKHLTPANAGILYDLYNKKTKANGLARSWYWLHPTDGNTYTVKFAEPMIQAWQTGEPGRSEIQTSRLYVLGTKP